MCGLASPPPDPLTCHLFDAYVMGNSGFGTHVLSAYTCRKDHNLHLITPAQSLTALFSPHEIL